MSSVERIQEQLTFKNFRRFLKIRDRRSGGLVTLKPNNVQRRIRAEIIGQMKAGRPVRIIILKSRRMGASTIIQATLAHIAFVTPDFSVITGAHEDKSSEYLHGMTEQMWRALPAPIQPTKEVGIRGKHLSFTHGSSLETFTAGNGSGVGRGGGWRAMHVSELGFWWNDPDETLQGLRQTIPNEPETIVVIESTANGMGGTFHTEWCRAVSGESDYAALFFAWFEFEDYRMRCSEPLEDLDADELALRRLGVNDEQLTWRRYTIANECGGSLEVFHQEYPAFPDEAFLSTAGRPVFVAQQLATAEALVPDPWARGFLTGTPVRNGTLSWIDADDGSTAIYSLPVEGHSYALFADVAGGVSEVDDEAREPGDKTDFCAAVVIDLATGRIVCEYEERIDADLYAATLARIGWLYRNDRTPALLAVEANNAGVLTISVLRDRLAYPNLYRRTVADHEHKGKRTTKLGWLTSEQTRPLMIAALKAALRDDPEALASRRLIAQMRQFVWSKGTPSRGSRAEARTGAHDDLVIAAAGVFSLYQQRAQVPVSVRKPDMPVTLDQVIRERSKKASRKSIASRAPRAAA